MRQCDSIGVLDSGVGGLSVLRQIHHILPQYATLYYADQAHVPYGPRAPREIDQFVENIADYLMAQGARVIVVACHAASSASLWHLRERYPDFPFVGMEPAVKPAVEATKTGVIGVLTTQATAQGALYKSVLERFAANTTVLTVIAPKLVEIVEQSIQHTPQGQAIIQEYLTPLLDANADQIVMACTHFPFLQTEIQAIIGKKAMIVDPGEAVARQVARILPADMQPCNQHRYVTSGDPVRFRRLVYTLAGIDIVPEGI
ncbi:MAG: glutamate racemase [Phototrophicales bacterium]|nr:MAG: glutamate racemase [Phototrophicales bacterium]